MAAHQFFLEVLGVDPISAGLVVVGTLLLGGILSLAGFLIAVGLFGALTRD